MKRRYILLLSALVLFTGAVIMTGCPANVKPQTQKYKVTLKSGKHGSVTVKPSLPADGMVEAHTWLSFTAQPDEGYEVDTWIMAAPRSADKKEAALTVAEKTTVTVTFKPKIKKYKIMLNKNEYGTVTVSPALPADGMVAAGSILTFTATPDSAYEVEAWTGAVANPSDSTKATLTVTAHTTISVTFKKKQANIALLNIDAGGYLKGVIDKDALVGDLIIPDTVTSISGYAFADCQGLTSVTIPNGVTSIGRYTFYDCLNLTHITIPDSVTEIEQLAFIGCSGLISITIPNGVTSIGYKTFEGCIKLTNIILPNSITSIGSCIFKDCKSLTNITIPNKVTIISSDAFENCVGLTQISIPSSVTKIDARAFKRCSKLKQISIPNSVTIIGIGAFYRCTGLTNITLGTGVTTINQAAFQDCKNLTSIIIPNSVSKIESWAFMDCDKLTSVTFENTAGWKVFASRTIAPEDLADASKAAKYLRNTYLDANWTRN